MPASSCKHGEMKERSAWLMSTKQPLHQLYMLLSLPMTDRLSPLQTGFEQFCLVLIYLEKTNPVVCDNFESTNGTNTVLAQS